MAAAEAAETTEAAETKKTEVKTPDDGLLGGPPLPSELHATGLRLGEVIMLSGLREMKQHNDAKGVTVQWLSNEQVR